MNTLEKYVGRAVRLNRELFDQLTAQARAGGENLENLFLVAKTQGMRKLICYGASLRIAVSAADVILV